MHPQGWSHTVAYLASLPSLLSVESLRPSLLSDAAVSPEVGAEAVSETRNIDVNCPSEDDAEVWARQLHVTIRPKSLCLPSQEPRSFTPLQ